MLTHGPQMASKLFESKVEHILDHRHLLEMGPAKKHFFPPILGSSLLPEGLAVSVSSHQTGALSLKSFSEAWMTLVLSQARMLAPRKKPTSQ